MIRLDYSKRPLVENAERLNVSVFMRKNMTKIVDILKSKGIEVTNFTLTDENILKQVLKALEETVAVNITQTRGSESDTTDPIRLKLTYTRSNLGKGFIIWFKCNNCLSRARYLYATTYNPYFYCRKCHGLVYKKQNLGRDRLVAKMLRNPEIIYSFLDSGSWKYQMAAMKAQMIRERARVDIYQEVEDELNNE